MEKLVNVDDVLFDETMYVDEHIPTRDHALSFVRYYSDNVGRFRTQLSQRGWSFEDINALIDMLWVRVINGCIKFRVPLTYVAQVNAERLGINYK
jgi:hypothetical protein